MNIFKYILFSISLAYLLSSCSNTKYLAEDQSLYVGVQVKIIDTFLDKKTKKSLEDELASYVRPNPNSKFLGIGRLKLLVYNLAGEPKSEKGIRHWLRNKFGEPPVLADDVRLEMNNLIIENQLFNKGLFNATSLGEKITKNKKTTARFEVIAGPQFVFDTVKFMPFDTTQLAHIIRSEQINTTLRQGAPYNLQVIENERERIAQMLNNKGYYFFNADYLLMVVDTSRNEKGKVNVRVELKNDIIPAAAKNAFRINEINIFSNYRTRNSVNLSNANVAIRPEDTFRFEQFTVLDRGINNDKKLDEFGRRQISVRDVVFDESLVYSKGDLYSVEAQNKSLNRLVGTDLFKFVKSEYQVVRDSTSMNATSNLVFGGIYNTLIQRGILATKDPKLDVYYYLTQHPKKRMFIDYGLYNLSDQRNGSKLSVNWRNRNVFRGAELLTINASGGFEVYYGGNENRPNNYNGGLEANIQMPRFLVPFFKIKSATNYLPKTMVRAKYELALRTNAYRINSMSVALGYLWKEDAKREHKLFPININYVKTDTFSNTSQLLLQNVLFNGLIIGPTYEFTYNTQVGPKKKSEFYFNGLLDMSGNILGLIQGADYNKGVEKIFDNPYAQYVKIQGDFRHYWNFDSKSSLASRFYIGYGLPWGNSRILPNVKQLFTGGISSIRGFSARMLGPGSYHLENSKYIEMLGDIKLEINNEYRTQLYNFIHGAVFIDAGNVWLQKENSEFPGGTFSKDFWKELAIGAGVGLRFDFSVIMLRLDIGMPLYKPWLPEGDRWTFNKIKIGDGKWRTENLVFGFAVGYPF